MIITCISKNILVVEKVKQSFKNDIIFIADNKELISKSFNSDIFIIDISEEIRFFFIDLSAILAGASQKIILYSNIQILNELLNNNSINNSSILSSSVFFSKGIELNNYSDIRNTPASIKIPQHYAFSNNIQWDKLIELFNAFTQNSPDNKKLLNWISVYLGTYKSALFEYSDNAFRFLESHNCETELLASFNIPVKSDFINHLKYYQPVAGLPGIINGLNDTPSDIQKILLCISMSAAILIENSDKKHILFLSSKISGLAYNLNELTDIKGMIGYLLCQKEFFIPRKNEINSEPLTEVKNSTQIEDISNTAHSLLHNFAMRTSNEFKNALVSIKTFTQLFPMKYKDSNFRKDFFNVISVEVDRIENLMDTIGFFSSPCTPNLKLGDIIPIINMAYKFVSSQHPEFTIKLKKEQKSLLLMFDDKLICRAITALLMNAAQAMNGKGEVIIDIQVPKIKRIGSFVEISITDNGCGIPSDIKNNIFEPFVSTKPNGLGLGLTFVKAVFESHGGKIEYCETKENRETKFIFTIPHSSELSNSLHLQDIIVNNS
ncbi:MAG: two-component sensor histidine kinase (stage II sporulation protein J) [uncultured bacterium]|nr:MAG: two-component sensor histidine kinase (stage II sporulation protein J) [uncultured bacterium]